MMTMDTLGNNTAALWPLGTAHDACRWMDGGSAAMQAWFALQQALWQPWWDVQAEWLRQCGAASLVPPPWATRGAEQLA